MDRKIVQELFDFIDNSPDPYHSAKSCADMLERSGYVRINEGDTVYPDGKYYVMRGDSSLIAFRTPADGAYGFTVAAGHGDSPCFRVKVNCEHASGGYRMLNCERYGGFWHASWFDRPLRISGRVYTGGECVEGCLFELPRPSAVIPSVAIHLNRSMNENFVPDPARDLVPLFGNAKGSGLLDIIAENLGIDASDVLSLDAIIGADAKGETFGDEGQFMISPRLDDLMCVFTMLRGFLAAEECESVPMFCLFDGEEIGSTIKDGAASDLLPSVARMIAKAYADSDEDTEEAYRRMLRSSFLVSADNAHAIHPNHPELSDADNSVKLNGGVVIKHSAPRRYTTDAESSAIAETLCRRAGVPAQHFCNKSNNPGGSTLGSIASSGFPVCAVDIGAAQFAMHSAAETAGAVDTEYLVRFAKELFSTSFRWGDGKVWLRGTDAE